MAIIFLILSTFLTSQINSQFVVTQYNTENEENKLSSASIFTTQIQQFRSAPETSPVTTSGNNLNFIGTVAAPRDSLFAQDENFRSISRTESFNSKEIHNKGRNNKEDDILSSNINEVEFSSNKLRDRIGVAKPIVWDSCLESNLGQNDIFSPQRSITDHNYIKNNYQSQVKKDLANIWIKRNVDSEVNNSDAMKAWLDKYNDLKNKKSDERRQQKPHQVLITKIISAISTDTPSPTVQIIPITREVFKEVVELNTTKSIVTESDIRASYTEDWFETKDSSKIKFNSLPQRESYLIPTLKIEAGFHPFSFMSQFFYLIYPYDFPVGE